MHSYRKTDDFTGLEPLPPLSSQADYRIVEGDPRASIRFDLGSGASKHRMGLWQCTPGAFECIEKGEELQTVLAGVLELIDEDGAVQRYVAGDSIFTRKGEKVTWRIIETVTKVFFTWDSAAKQ